MATASETQVCTEQGQRRLPPHQQAAFIGLLRAHAELTRSLDDELSRRHGLGLSAYEMLSRLDENEHLRLSRLAAETGLSLSRISRLMDQLERRGLTGRNPCPGDSRVVHATITDEGRELVREAQDTFFAVVEDRFLGRLSCDEVSAMGEMFARVLDKGAARTAEPEPAPAA